LTAESVAELLHRPLYSVSVGELGTDTNELEKKLTEILEVSSSWNAVILLDEADVCTPRPSDRARPTHNTRNTTHDARNTQHAQH
jgi:hypothetical protein